MCFLSAIGNTQLSVHTRCRSMLPSRVLEMVSGVFDTRLELSVAPGNVTMLWTELELASSTYM